MQKEPYQKWCISQLLDVRTTRKLIVKLLTLVCLRIHKAIYDKSNLPFNFENKYFDKLWDLQNRFFCTHRPIKRKLTSRATQLLPHTQISRARKTSKIRAK